MEEGGTSLVCGFNLRPHSPKTLDSVTRFSWMQSGGRGCWESPEEGASHGWGTRHHARGGVHAAMGESPWRGPEALGHGACEGASWKEIPRSLLVTRASAHGSTMASRRP